MTVAVLFPRRADGGRRDRLFEFCRKWWEKEHPEWELIEGHHDDGLFNRAAAVNAAAAQTEAEVLVIADGDVIPPQVGDAVALAAETGRAVLAYQFDGYTPLTAEMTDRALDGYDGRWDTPQGVSRGDRSKDHISSCVVVPRALFDLVSGMDERFHGWGPEDREFHHRLRVLGGGVLRVPGQVFHLHHPFSPERNRKTPDWLAGEALNRACEAIHDPEAMRRRIADAKVTDGVLAVFVSNRRTDYLPAALESFRRVTGPITRVVVVDDSGDLDHHAWLRLHHPDIDLIATNGKAGFDGVYRRIWEAIAGYGLPWAFVVEEDFTFDRDVDLSSMQRVMNDRPHLVQMALRRQAWSRPELAAGGIIEMAPDRYEDHPTHLEHREFFTTNPTLLRRDFVTHNPWPRGAGSELRFAREVFRNESLRSGYWGARTDDPWIIHHGERTGSGY